ncbi:hypothetical protein [Halobellus rufus]|uniref:hypothetical protein n=1 Tax=Halobellus rufus TaxID=1448860 RepID=UPI0006791412|nr:hypothetical protein [Halobellus rufus]
MTSSSSYGSSFSGAISEYANLRTLPAIFSVAFVATSLYQFGGVTEITLVWLSNYSLTAEHAALAGIAVYAAAFMSSETKRFEHYETWEQVSLGLVPILTLGYQYTSQIPDLLNSIGDPLGAQIAFLATLFGWFVAVR